MRPVDWLVRLEWAVAAIGTIWLYALTGNGWLLFAVLLLAPDLAMLGYLAGPRVGSWAYNAVHTLALSLPAVAAGYLLNNSLLVGLGLIWTAHIAIDRALGYGLKLPTDFRDTHLGRIGRG